MNIRLTHLCVAFLALSLAACASDDSTTDPTPDTNAPSGDTNAPPEDGTSPAQNIVEIAQSDDQFSTLVTAVGAAGYAETLSGEGPFTVFAPTNDAFAALDPALLQAALDDPTGLLTDVLLYHVVSGKVMASDVVGLSSATTLNGADISITVTAEGKVMLNDTIEVTMTDIEASNGVIHVIDGVLLPPAEPAMKNIVEIAQSDEKFSTLVTAVAAAGYAETLSGEGPFTVFAPTNDAFAALDPAIRQAALDDPTGLLTNVLLYHVVSGKVMASDVVGLSSATTLNGADISITVTAEGKVMLNDTIEVTMTDIEASNGVIHVIDGVLLPPS